jgi:hypothetical protein
MKILVTETFLHPMANGKGWLEGINQLGHEGYALQSQLYTLNQVDEQMDVIVFMGMHTVNLEHITDYKNRFPTTKMVAVCYGFEESYLNLAPYIDLWVEHNYKHDLVDHMFQQNGMKLVHLPLASSTDMFKRLDIPKTYDVSFVGNFGHGYREQDIYLDPIIKLGVSGFYSGFYEHPTVPPQQLNSIYNSSKINLNFHYQHQKTQSDKQSDSIDFNSRIFDIALSGNFQLCDHPFTSLVFEDGVKYTSKENWMDVFQHYLNNEDDRLDMAQKAQAICLQKHTWKVRMEEFINHINTL